MSGIHLATRSVAAPSAWRAAFTTHVTDFDAGVVATVERGLWCRICRTEFRAWLWPHDGMLIECLCPCACHKSG
jgi:hypothetical protein